MNFFRTTGQQAQVYVMGRRPVVFEAVLAQVDGKLAYWTLPELLSLERIDPDSKVHMNGEDIYIVRTKQCKS